MLQLIYYTPTRGCTMRHIIITDLLGPQNHAHNVTSPLKSWELFFPGTVMEQIVYCSNTWIQERCSKCSRLKITWKPILCASQSYLLLWCPLYSPEYPQGLGPITTPVAKKRRADKTPTSKAVLQVVGEIFVWPWPAQRVWFYCNTKDRGSLLYLADMLKSDLWSTDGTGVEIFRVTMIVNGFRSLLHALWFNSIHTRNMRMKHDHLVAIT